MSKSFKKDRDQYEDIDESVERQKKKFDRILRQIKKNRRDVDLKQDNETRPKK